MQVTEENRAKGDGPAIAFGCGAGFIGGALFGGLIWLLLGDTRPDLTFILIVHTTLAMTIMGGWTAPSLLEGS